MDYLNSYSTPSSTSFDCDCYVCEAGLDCRNIRRTPFYPTMGQPLIYYAAVPTKGGRRPNCFKRAFHWYTDDRQPERREQQPSNLGAFASWLDSKYEQFLRENPHACGVKITQTSFQACAPQCTPDAHTSSDPCNPCSKKKKFSKGRSLLRRRRCGGSRTEERTSSDDRLKQSMEYIMPPKDLNRAASACCHAPTPTSCGSVQQQRYVTKKSQSLTSVAKEQTALTEEDKIKEPMKFDNPPVEKKSSIANVSQIAAKEISEEKEVIFFEKSCCDKSCQCIENIGKNEACTQCVSSQSNNTSGPGDKSSCATEICSCSSDQSWSPTVTPFAEKKKDEKKPRSSSRSKKEKADSKSKKSKSKSSVLCQCPVVPLVEAQVQCDPAPSPQPAPRPTCLECHCSNCDGSSTKQSGQSTKSYQYEPFSAPISQQNVIINNTSITQQVLVEKCVPDCKRVKLCTTRTQGTLCVGYHEFSAQTSDRAINLEQEIGTVHGYPLYLKILRADKPT